MLLSQLHFCTRKGVLRLLLQGLLVLVQRSQLLVHGLLVLPHTAPMPVYRNCQAWQAAYTQQAAVCNG